MEFRLIVRGDRACFKRPEFVADVVSYDVMTPLAARAIFETIHAAPELRWRIEEIRVLNVLRSTWMALGDVVPIDPGGPLPLRVTGPADRRTACVLTDVAYVLTARMVPLGAANTIDTHVVRFRRRIASGTTFRPVYLGLRGFAATVDLLDPVAPVPPSALAGSGAIDLGWMLFDRAPDGAGPRFFRATMIDGVIDLRHRDALILAG